MVDDVEEAHAVLLAHAESVLQDVATSMLVGLSRGVVKGRAVVKGSLVYKGRTRCWVCDSFFERIWGQGVSFPDVVLTHGKNSSVNCLLTKCAGNHRAGSRRKTRAHSLSYPAAHRPGAGAGSAGTGQWAPGSTAPPALCQNQCHANGPGARGGQ